MCNSSSNNSSIKLYANNISDSFHHPVEQTSDNDIQANVSETVYNLSTLIDNDLIYDNTTIIENNSYENTTIIENNASENVCMLMICMKMCMKIILP